MSGVPPRRETIVGTGLEFIVKRRFCAPLLFLACQAGGGHLLAESVAVRYPEGVVRGFLVLRALDGSVLANGDEIQFSRDASYVHICTNNTIEGTQWSAPPETGSVPLVADMSSDIASRTINVNKYGMIFAGAQKNLGPSGVTVVILRKDLAERADRNLPTVLQYRTHIKEKSLYHTPPTFAVYIVGLVLEWRQPLRGVTKPNGSGRVLESSAIEHNSCVRETVLASLRTSTRVRRGTRSPV